MEVFIEKNKTIIVSAAFILSVFLVFFHFTDTPKVWVDEGVFTEVAKNLVKHGVLGLQTKPGEFFPMNNFLLSASFPVIIPVAVSFQVFGFGLWQARLPMLLFMLGLIFLFYLYTKKRYNFSVAVLSVLTLISFSPFYGNGRPVQGEVPGIFFLVLGLYLLLKLEKKNFLSNRLAIFSGLSFGLSASTKPIFLALLSCAMSCILFIWFRKVQNKKIFIYFGVSFLVPVILWFSIHFPEVQSFSKILEPFLYFASNHESSQSLSTTILTNLTRFFTESTPFLFTFLFASTIFYFVYSFLKNKTEIFYASDYVVLFFIVLNWVSYLVGTGWYRYFFPAHVLLYLLFTGTIFALTELLTNYPLKKMIVLIPLLLIVLQFSHLIFLSDTSFVVERTRNSELAEGLSGIDGSKSILLYNTIDATVFLKTDSYSQYLSMGNFLEAGDKNALTNPDEDFILTGRERDYSFELPCYKAKVLNRFYLFERKNDCKIK